MFHVNIEGGHPIRHIVLPPTNLGHFTVHPYNSLHVGPTAQPEGSAVRTEQGLDHLVRRLVLALVDEDRQPPVMHVAVLLVFVTARPRPALRGHSVYGRAPAGDGRLASC